VREPILENIKAFFANFFFNFKTHIPKSKVMNIHFDNSSKEMFCILVNIVTVDYSQG